METRQSETEILTAASGAPPLADKKKGTVTQSEAESGKFEGGNCNGDG